MPGRCERAGWCWQGAIPGGCAGRGRGGGAARLLGPGTWGGPRVAAGGRGGGINAMVSGGWALGVPTPLVTRLRGGATERPTLGITAKDVALPPALAARARSGAARGVL